jgi:hypothetical protein
MKQIHKLLIFSVLIVTYACNENSKHNASMVSFGGMKPHDRLSLNELESNFDSPNDFVLISHFGKDMDFNSDYEEGDSLVTFYKYHLESSQKEQVGIVFTFGDKAETICAPCAKDKVKEYEGIYRKSTSKNIDKTIDALDSLEIRKK